jgi:hypothetical protein
MVAKSISVAKSAPARLAAANKSRPAGFLGVTSWADKLANDQWLFQGWLVFMIARASVSGRLL